MRPPGLSRVRWASRGREDPPAGLRVRQAGRNAPRTRQLRGFPLLQGFSPNSVE